MASQGRSSSRRGNSGRGGQYTRGMGRGGYGRGGRGGRAAAESHDQPCPPFGELIKTFQLDDVDSENSDSEADFCGISDVEHVASYTWIGGAGPKIIVPGKPPRWTPPRGRQQLCEDKGTFYRDLNAALYPRHPAEPAVVAIMRMHPEPLRVDIVACGSTLGSLLRHVSGKGQDFRMLVEAVGQTVHLIRRERSPTETLAGVRGFGHSFLEAYTSLEPGYDRSLSHQRIIKYRLGGLNLLVRSEVDGFVGSEKQQPRTKDETDPLRQMEFMRLGQSDTPANAPAAVLKVTNGGTPEPQDALMDIKTRSVKAKHVDTLGEQLPRLWARQLHKFVLAHHTYGLFEDVQVRDISVDVQQWEADNQAALRQLVGLLRSLARSAMADQGGKLELRGTEDGKLELRRKLPDAGEAFSPSVRLQWEDWLDEGRNKVSSDEDDSSQSDGGASCDRGSEDLTACDKECGYCGKCRY